MRDYSQTTDFPKRAEEFCHLATELIQRNQRPQSVPSLFIFLPAKVTSLKLDQSATEKVKFCH